MRKVCTALLLIVAYSCSEPRTVTTPPRVKNRLAELAASQRRPESPEERDRRVIREAMVSHSCTGTEDMYGWSLSPEEKQYLLDCQAAAQHRLLPIALETGNCAMITRLPGGYPFHGTAAEQRFVYHCWMKAGQAELDSCIGIRGVGDETSLPLITAVRQKNSPFLQGGRVYLIDTTRACMSAYKNIAGVSEADFRRTARGWGGTWAEWAVSNATPN